jgi:hypothetical protein
MVWVYLFALHLSGADHVWALCGSALYAGAFGASFQAHAGSRLCRRCRIHYRSSCGSPRLMGGALLRSNRVLVASIPRDRCRAVDFVHP